MSFDLNSHDYEAFSRYLQEACGIVLGDNKQYLVQNRLHGLLSELAVGTVGALLDKANREPNSNLNQRIVDAMTTNETLWFRDQYPFEALKRMILPELSRQNLPRIKIWSSACSYGQEPYSISMIVEEYRRDYQRHPLKDVHIMATDISPTVLKHAREGAYDSLSMARGLSTDRRAQFFHDQGDKAVLKEEVQRQVHFRELNLIKSFPGLGKFHVIFCRNVLIYFSNEQKQDILNRFADALEPNGYLFLGGSESITRHSDRFCVSRAHGGMVFRLAD